MKEKFKNFIDKIKTAWGKLSSGVRKIIIIALSALLVLALVLTIVLNVNKGDGYIVLFPNMADAEATEVYQYLRAEGVSTKINSDGEIMVPQEQWDTLVYDLAQKGYPQSAPSYGTYFDNLSMTMTDSEKQQLIIKDLQDRLQITLNRIDGIKGSVVTISAPEENNYAWKENSSKPSASVALTLDNPYAFTGENVAAVKNLVAFATHQMKPEDVVVIDTTTGKELGIDDGKEKEYDIISRENYENIIRKRIEESVEEILSKPYGRDNVSAACTVSINYDKINEEMLEYLTNENDEGVVDWKHIIYKGEGIEELPAEGVSGEEDNADIPSYPNEAEDYTITDPDYLEREITYSIGHVLTQTEKAQGVITDSTIAITIKTPSPLSNVEKSGVIDLVKNATAIDDTTKISVFDWQSDELEEETPPGMLSKDKVKDYKILLLILALIAITLIAIIIVILVRRDAKKKIQANEKKNKRAVDQLEAKLAETKRRSLVEMANETNKEQKETKDEVRQFALDNPDLTAAIVRSMIKEDEYSSTQEQEDGE